MMITLLSVLFSSAQAMPSAETTFTTLLNKPVFIECTSTGEAWCRAKGVMSAPIDKVSGALEDMSHSDQVFESVRSVEMLEPNVLHITLDFPMAFADRDYISKYSQRTEGEDRIYAFIPVKHEKAPAGKDGAVRLDKMGGEWRLTPKDGATLVSYTWQADLGGSFPGWALSTARKRTGTQILSDLAKSLDAKVVAP